MSGPTEVRRVETPHGSHIEPPLDPKASKLDRLRWHAAVVQLDSGIPVRVVRSEYTINGILQGGHFDIVTPRSTSGPYPYDDAWTLLNGIRIGARSSSPITAPNKGDAVAALDRIVNFAYDAAALYPVGDTEIDADYETVMACLAAPQSVVDALIPPQDTTLFEQPGGAW